MPILHTFSLRHLSTVSGGDQSSSDSEDESCSDDESDDDTDRLTLASHVKEISSEPKQVRWKNGSEFRDYLDGQDTQEWKKILIYTHGSGESVVKVYMEVRADMHAVLSQMLCNRQVKTGHFRASTHATTNLAARFQDVRSGSWMLEAEDFVRRQYGPDVHVLPYALYSDETCVTLAGTHIHPIILSLCLPLDIMRRQHTHQRIAFLPVLAPAEFGMDAVVDRERFKTLKRNILRLAATRALRDLKLLSFRPEIFAVGPHLRHLTLLALPACYIADLLEAHWLLGVKHFPAKFPDITHLVPKESLDEHLLEFPRRTQEGLLKTLEKIKALRDQGNNKAAEKLADEQSLMYTEQGPLVGFNFTDCFELVWPDELHQGQKGDQEHLINLFIDILTPRELKAVNEEILTCRPFSGLRLPMYLQWQQLRDLEVHTEQTLTRLGVLTKRFQELAKTELGHLKSFAYPKFFALRKYVDLIRRLGSAMVASASTGESTHKELKNAHKHTNKNKHTVMDQVIRQCRRVDAARLEADADDLTMKTRSAGQMAAVTNMHVLVKTKKKLHLAKLNSDAVDCTEQAMLKAQPELAQLEWCLRIMLADYPAIPWRLSQESFMKDLPSVHHGVVYVHPALAVPYVRHRGSATSSFMLRAVPSFGQSKREAFDFVAVKCSEEDAGETEGGCWFAELRLIFSCRDHRSMLQYQPAVIRIDAGSLDDTPFTDTADNTWTSDARFVGGSTEQSTDTIQAATDGAESVYGTCRVGRSFQYAFTTADGLEPGGTYMLALHFVELYFEAAGARVFSVVVNGEEKISGLDIFAQAGVEVLLPAIMRINAGGLIDYTDSDGIMWKADHSFVGDGREASTATLPDVADNLQPIYEDNHLAPEFSYVLYPADGLTPSASYIVVLDFIELDATAAGTRLFNVQINGQAVLQSFDVFAEAGGQRLVPVRRHFDVALGSGGVLILTFTGVQRSATVAGIEIYPAPLTVGGLPILAPAAAPTPAPAPAVTAPDGTDIIKRLINGRKYIDISSGAQSAQAPSADPAAGGLTGMPVGNIEKEAICAAQVQAQEQQMLLVQSFADDLLSQIMQKIAQGYSLQEVADAACSALISSLQDEIFALQTSANWLVFEILHLLGAGWTFDSRFVATAEPGMDEITKRLSIAPQLSQPCLERDRLCEVADRFRERIKGLEAALAALKPPVVTPAPAPEGLVITPANPPTIAPGGNGDKAPATAPSGLGAPAPGPVGPQDQGDPSCPLYPIPAYSGPEVTSLGIVRVVMRYEEPFQAPKCAPECLMRLGCGEASFDPQEQGWPISRGVVFEPSDDLCTYTTFFYQLFILMLFNFSKPVASFTSDDVIVRGGAVREVLTVPSTNLTQYIVWVAVTPGTGSFSIAIRPGKVQDAAGNVLYSDLTSPEIFGVDSNNGQYTVPIPGNSTGSSSILSAMAGARLSRGAVIGLVVGLVVGFLLAFLALCARRAILRRMRDSYQKHDGSGEVAGKTGQGLPPKMMAFTDATAQKAALKAP
ncbi:hypothetical protein WJX75_005808 [Coccomyxa subellipsoidea]|uniref:Malectin domain-containing protein n=1 Tax=Coccomyxa subellipsoidea TaxID=248742 RepID=A0ABR2YD97_9CHLO